MGDSPAPLVRIGGYYRYAFPSAEETEYVVATFKVRIAVDTRQARDYIGPLYDADRMADYAGHAVAALRPWRGAQVDSVELVSISPERDDD